jgi:MarR family 2-MHQ and catechol resistance regulon transcriptional repressor
MTAAVDRIESMSLVVRKTTAKDRRARVLELTRKGRRLIERAIAEHTRHLENAMSVLDDDERRRLYAGLKKLGQFVAPTLDGSHSEAEDK